ncbi:10907_t:CDS:1 [Acaulospora colombiana]|uniref:10907_t:CDS:1 n=1 Tax=Acaulospora colombiana TaxID=27376 RepID=A0ACA9M4H5_9GLOM|nr:10907_t:CDS:1 [Acaulospora colombiana]
MFDELFRRHSIIDRLDQKSLYEEECRRLIGIVEHLTEQRKETIEVIRTTNTFISDLILSLQSHNPQKKTLTSNPNGAENDQSGLLDTISKQINEMQKVIDDNQESVEGEEFVEVDINGDERESSSSRQNLSNSNDELVQKYNDEGLKTELVILQSQINRLKVEQTKITDLLEDHKHCKSSSSLNKSSGGDYRRRSPAQIQIEDVDCDGNDDGEENSSSSRGSFGTKLRRSTYLENETYTDLLKRQDREINKLRQKCKEYEETIKTSKSSRRSDDCSIEVHNTSKNKEGNSSFKCDIKKLQKTLQNFTSITNTNTEVSQEQANSLLELYQLDTIRSDPKISKKRLSCALEAQIVKRLIEQLDGYFSINDSTDNAGDYDEDNLELDIVFTTDKLTTLMTKFVQRRSNCDELAKQIPKRIKKVVYEMMSKHAFSLNSKTFDDSKVRSFDNTNHPFIASLVQQLVNFMDQYRTIRHSEGSINVQSEAEKLIREFISVMWFRTKTLDPAPQMHYYPKGSGVDAMYMKEDITNVRDTGKGVMINGGDKGAVNNVINGWDKQENFSVEICYFPAIFDEQTNTVYSKAQVLTRKS